MHAAKEPDDASDHILPERPLRESDSLRNAAAVSSSDRQQRSRLASEHEKPEARGFKGQAKTPLTSKPAPFRPSEPRMLLRQRAASRQNGVEPWARDATCLQKWFRWNGIQIEMARVVSVIHVLD